MSIVAERLPRLSLEPLPEIDLRQLFALTDDTGILQHAIHAVPNLDYGYCTDDMARALIVHASTRWLIANSPNGDEKQRRLALFSIPIQRALAFLSHAYDPGVRRFRNFMSYDRRWLEEAGSEDCHGRAMWALGIVVAYAPNDPIRQHALDLLLQALSAFRGFRHVRPVAFGLQGLHFALVEDRHSEILSAQAEMAEWLYSVWRKNASAQWPWWEDILTWGNAELSDAMIVSGSDLDRPEMVEAGLTSLRWLIEVQTTPEGHLSLVGNRGWYPRGGERARFDQQPLDAQALMRACLCAARVTGETFWLERALPAFEWFLGRNDLGLPLYHPETGGCQDGLLADCINCNQGAESTLAYILSVLELHLYARERNDAPSPVNVRIHD